MALFYIWPGEYFQSSFFFRPKCLINITGGMLSGSFQSTDQDKDVEYMMAKRDMPKGNQGTFTRTGGTGKYANSAVTCAYVVELSDFGIGVGYLTANCKE